MSLTQNLCLRHQYPPIVSTCKNLRSINHHWLRNHLCNKCLPQSWVLVPSARSTSLKKRWNLRESLSVLQRPALCKTNKINVKGWAVLQKGAKFKVRMTSRKKWPRCHDGRRKICDTDVLTSKTSWTQIRKHCIRALHNINSSHSIQIMWRASGSNRLGNCVSKADWNNHLFQKQWVHSLCRLTRVNRRSGRCRLTLHRSRIRDGWIKDFANHRTQRIRTCSGERRRKKKTRWSLPSLRSTWSRLAVTAVKKCSYSTEQLWWVRVLARLTTWISWWKRCGCSRLGWSNTSWGTWFKAKNKSANSAKPNK